MKVLLTTTSFQDTPGIHHDLLNKQLFNVDKLRGPLLQKDLLPIIANYDAVICGDDEYTKEVIEKGASGKLKYISKYGVGLDRIDLKAANNFNISVSNCPSVNQVSVAEHVLALLFTFERNIHLQYNSVQKGSWNRLVGNEIQGKTIGIIGLGSVGKELSKKSFALGMKVIAYDIYVDETFSNNFPEIEIVNSLDTIYKNADIISLHIPHTPKTEFLINRDVIFNKLNKNTLLINTSRGMLVDSVALIEGIKKEKIRGYLTDVLANEPIIENEILLGVENIIITPHIGSRTHQSVQRQGCMAVNNLLKMIDEGN